MQQLHPAAGAAASSAARRFEQSQELASEQDTTQSRNACSCKFGRLCCVGAECWLTVALGLQEQALAGMNADLVDLLRQILRWSPEVRVGVRTMLS